MPERLHALHLVEDFAPRDRLVGGAPISVRLQIEALSQHGRMSVLAPARAHPPGARYAERRRRQAEVIPDHAFEDPDGVRVFRPRLAHVPLLWPLLEPWQIGLRARRAARELGGIDLVHGHRAYPMGVAAVLAGRQLGVPSVITAHGSDVHTQALRGSPRVRFGIRWALARAGLVLAVSKRLERILLDLGLPPERVRQVPNGVDAERFRIEDRGAARARLGITEPGPLFLSIGFLVPIKGHAVLLEALGRLRDRCEARLALAGDGPLAASLRERAEALGLGGRVRFLGRIPHAEAPSWIAASDAVVLPSLDEGTPLTAIEALACGRPIVGSEVGGIPDVVSDDRFGHLVPPEDPQALSDALERALRTEWVPERLRSRALEYAWPRIAERIHAHYRDLLAGSGPGTAVAPAARAGDERR